MITVHLVTLSVIIFFCIIILCDTNVNLVNIYTFSYYEQISPYLILVKKVNKLIHIIL